jgi:hypothetical protein
MERNSTIGAWRLPGGINSAADKGVSVMILSYKDSVPPTFADKQVNAYGALGLQSMPISEEIPVVPRGKQGVFEHAAKADGPTRCRDSVKVSRPNNLLKNAQNW